MLVTRKECELVFSGETRIIWTFSTGVWVISWLQGKRKNIIHRYSVSCVFGSRKKMKEVGEVINHHLWKPASLRTGV